MGSNQGTPGCGRRRFPEPRLLKKHPVAVSRWVADAARQRVEDPGYTEKLEALDKALDDWALKAHEEGDLAVTTLNQE